MKKLVTLILVGLLLTGEIAGILALAGHSKVAADEPPEPVSISFGETISGAIDPVGDTDTYTFTASAGDTVIIRLDKTSGSLYPRVRLYSPSGTILKDDYTSDHMEMQCTLPDDGQYKITVCDDVISYTGGYNLYLQRLNNPSSTTPIGFGQTLSGSIDPYIEIDFYHFTASAGDTVIIRLDKTSGSLYPRVRLYSPSGTILKDDYTSDHMEMQCTLPDDGQYKITVCDDVISYTGGYNLYLQRLNNPSSTTPIGFGQTLSGSIDPYIEIDFYHFTASAGDTVIIRLDKTSGSLYPRVRLYSPSGTILKDDYTSDHMEMQCTLPDDGQYKITVCDDVISYTGGYNLYLQRLNNPSSTTPIGFGQTLSGSIDPYIEIDFYHFTASAGDTVIIRLDKTSGSLYPRVRLYSPSGTILKDDYTSDHMEMQCTLPDDGQYKITVCDDVISYTGGYNLYLQRLNNPSSTTPIGFGQTLSGSIDPYIEIDFYHFTASAGDTVIIRLDKTSGSLYPRVRLYSPSGTILKDDYTSDHMEMQCTLPDDGQYKITVCDDVISYTGGYNLYLQRLNNPSSTTPIGFGQTLSGSIDPYIEIDFYHFTASAGDTVIIRLDKTSGSLYPRVRLYSPSGTILKDDYTSDHMEMQCTLPDDGQYKITVCDDVISYTGGYNLYLQCLNNPISLTLTLQGSSRPDPSGWEIPVTVKFFDPGSDPFTEPAAYEFNPTTSKDGDAAVCEVTGIAPGTYDITVVSEHTLMNVKRNVVITAPGTSVDMGTLLEGDWNGNLTIDWEDLGTVLVTYDKCQGVEGFDPAADFNRNGCIDWEDLGLVLINYDKGSPVEVE